MQFQKSYKKIVNGLWQRIEKILMKIDLNDLKWSFVLINGLSKIKYFSS